MLDLYWQAVLTDGATITQGDIPFTDLFVKKFQLQGFRLINREDNRIIIAVALDKNKRLICRKRPELKMNQEGETNDTGRTVWIVGWQQTLNHFRDERGNPCNVQQVSLVYWNGCIVVRDGFGGSAGYPIELLPQEVAAGMFDPRTVKGSTEPEPEPDTERAREPEPED